MSRLLGGECRLFLIQHRSNLPVSSKATATAALPDSKLDLVRAWTDEGRYEGRYEGATIVPHSQPRHPRYPTLQSSYRIGLELALREQADLYVWLEDDSFIYDEDVAAWPALMQGQSVGVFRPYCKHVHCAFLVSSPSYDRRLLPIFSSPDLGQIRHEFPSTSSWTPAPGHIEYYTTWAAENRIAFLDRSAAARIHPGVADEELLRLSRRIVPEAELPLLDLDFPGIC